MARMGGPSIKTLLTPMTLEERYRFLIRYARAHARAMERADDGRWRRKKKLRPRTDGRDDG